MLILPSKKALYSGTITGLRISAVDGTAFLDACSAITSYADGTNEITIYDSAGAFLKATLKAQGSGETLGAELITTLNNGVNVDNARAYETFTPNVNGKDIDSAIDTDGDSYAYHDGTIITLGGLYKLVADITLNSGTAPSARVAQKNVSGIQYLTSIVDPLIDGTYYYTGAMFGVRTPHTIALKNDAVGNFSLVWSFKNITAPSTDGVTLQASKWDTTESFGVKATGFKYNEASYAVRVFKAR